MNIYLIKNLEWLAEEEGFGLIIAAESLDQP